MQSYVLILLGILVVLLIGVVYFGWKKVISLELEFSKTKYDLEAIRGLLTKMLDNNEDTENVVNNVQEAQINAQVLANLQNSFIPPIQERTNEDKVETLQSTLDDTVSVESIETTEDNELSEEIFQNEDLDDEELVSKDNSDQDEQQEEPDSEEQDSEEQETEEQETEEQETEEQEPEEQEPEEQETEEQDFGELQEIEDNLNVELEKEDIVEETLGNERMQEELENLEKQNEEVVKEIEIVEKKKRGRGRKRV